MKAAIFILSFVFSVVCHGQNLDFTPSISQAAAGEIEYSFDLTGPQSKVISDADIDITHEQLIHLIAYDESLTQFIHVHPIYDGKKWTVKFDAAVDGNYRVWIQGQLKQGNHEFTLGQRLLIENGLAAIPAPTELGDVRTGVSGITKVTLSGTKIKENKMVMLDLTITQTDGQIPTLEPYLGAFAHVIAVPIAGDKLIHVHPMEGSAPNVGMLHSQFPTAGDYRLWVQLINNGELIVVPLSVRVVKN